MNRLFSDLHSLPRVEANERIRQKSPVDVLAVRKSAVRTLQHLSEDPQSTVIMSSKSEAALVSRDSEQLGQIFLNLMANAFEYGRVGGTFSVTSRHESKSENLGGPAVWIDVANEGEGIDTEHLPWLTKRTYRIDGHRSRSVGGTGPILAIVKHYVRRHRGRLTIESDPGVAGMFSVALPVLSGAENR